MHNYYILSSQVLVGNKDKAYEVLEKMFSKAVRGIRIDGIPQYTK